MSATAMRRGACPSLAAPMPTGDGLLVRLRPASNTLSPRQLNGLARLAAEHGNGLLEITARGNLQIRGLTEASATLLENDVAAFDIEPSRGVPIETGPIAGLDPHEIADASPLAEAIRRAASDAGLHRRLGPKVTVVVDGGGRIGLGNLLADVRVSTLPDPAAALWLISLAGTALDATPVAVHTAPDVPCAVIDLLTAIAKWGTKARGRDLLASGNRLQLQPPTASAASRPPLPCRASPPHGGRSAMSAPLIISPLVGEMPGRAEGSGTVTTSTTSGTPSQPLPKVGYPLVGPLALNDGTQALSAALAFGQIGADELSHFALAAEKAGAEIRLAPQRRLLALGLSPASLDRLEQAASEAGMIVRPGDPRLGVVACAGAPACASAFFDTKALAATLAPLAGENGLHVSGCPKRCAEPTGMVTAIVGRSTDEADLAVNGEATPIKLSRAAEAVSRLARNRRKPSAAPPSPAKTFADTHHP